MSEQPDNSVYQDEDQDAEATMTAPAEGRPDGSGAGKEGTEGGSGGSTPDATGAS
jgi:hypothetical protein